MELDIEIGNSLTKRYWQCEESDKLFLLNFNPFLFEIVESVEH